MNDPIASDTPPLRGLCDGVAEQFGGEPPPIVFGERPLDEEQVLSFEMRKAREPQRVRIG
jgi:hypothetical protein